MKEVAANKNSIIVLILLHHTVHLKAVEWIEIPQKQQHQTPAITPRPTKIVQQTMDMRLSTPSPEWIAYQKERFGIAPHEGHKSQQLTINTEQHLPNSAQIIVPANVNVKPKNQIFQVTTRLDVKTQNANEASVVKPGNVETTSRQQSSDGQVEDVDDEVTEEAEQQEVEADEDIVDNEQDNPDFSEEPIQTTSDIRPPSIEGFIGFLKKIRRNWIKQSTLTFAQKINALKRLRDKLMLTIEKHFTALWQPVERKGRNKRGLLEESNLNFPPQTALLTISFLTFAVFLIKLVLQVVHILKSKHYNLANFNNQVQ